MMKCSLCKRGFPDGLLECPFCGTKSDIAPPVVTVLSEKIKKDDVKKVKDAGTASPLTIPSTGEQNKVTASVWRRFRDKYSRWLLFMTTNTGARRMMIAIFCISVLLLIISLRPWTWFKPQRLIYIPMHKHFIIQPNRPIKH